MTTGQTANTQYGAIHRCFLSKAQKMALINKRGVMNKHDEISASSRSCKTCGFIQRLNRLA